ncbi:MAG: DUF2945 domain-containing protein [Nocardioides sp.]
MAIRVGTTVSWAWGGSRAEGTVTALHHARVTRTIKRSRIVRHGTRSDPAYEIEQEDGSRVLKLRSEVQPQRWGWRPDRGRWFRDGQ